jgi:hypothetical protein
MSDDILVIEENGQEVEVVIKDINERERMKYSKWIQSQFPSLVNNPHDFKVTPKFIEFWQNLIPKMTSIDGMSLYSFSMESFNELVHACANKIAGRSIDHNHDSMKTNPDSSSSENDNFIDVNFDLNENGAVDLSDWQ